MLMKKIILLLLILPLVLGATDITIGLVYSPSQEIEYEVGSEMSFKLRIDNINVLIAEEYTIGVSLYSDSDYIKSLLQDTMKKVELPPNSTIDVEFESVYIPETSGSLYFRAWVYYFNDINRENDKIEYEITIIEKPEIICSIDTLWHSGPQLKVINNLDYFPKDKELNDYIQRGDVIALSALVTDDDILEQLCICNGDTNSKLIGSLSDDVIYEWVLEGEGRLIFGDDTSPNKSNMVMYEIPVCSGKDRFKKSVVTLNIRNSNSSLAPDKSISGKFEIFMDFCPQRIYPADIVPDWCSSCISVQIKKEDLIPQPGTELTSKEGEACLPADVTFDLYNPITSNAEIIVDTARYCLPDYAVLLTADASDQDRIDIACESGESGCQVNDEENPAKMTILHEDAIEYTWEIVTGKGAFPLGNKGKSVVFHKSRSEGATIKCIMSNQNQNSKDANIEKIITLEKSKKPKAFVGIGDDEDTGLADIIYEWWHETDVYGGQEEGFTTIANYMKEEFEEDGYEVYFQAKTSEGLLNTVLQDPIYQAFCIVGHGLGGAMILSGGGGPLGFDEYTATSAMKAHLSAYNCSENPKMRDVQLIGCEAMKGNWSSAFHCGARVHGWRTTKRLGSLKWYALWTFEALPVVNLSLD